MKIAEDLYMWIRIARRYEVCFSPERLVRYSRVASNRSAASYTPETDASIRSRSCTTRWPPRRTGSSWPAPHWAKRLSSAPRAARRRPPAPPGSSLGRETYRRTLRKVRALNALPAGWRGPVIRLYNALAWRLARKGL